MSEFDKIKNFKFAEGFESSFRDSVLKAIEGDFNPSEKQQKWFELIVDKAGADWDFLFSVPAKFSCKKIMPVVTKKKQSVLVEENVPDIDVDLGDMEARKWQKKAFDKWVANKYKGIVQAATGTGKSILGVVAMKHLDTPPTLFVVHTIQLMYQWKKLLESKCGVDVGLIGDGHNVINRVTVAVINSLRDGYSSLDDSFDLVVLDEAHHYSSPENLKPFLGKKFKYALGLTATMNKDADSLKSAVGDIIFNYDVADGQDDGVLVRAELVNVGVDLNDAEFKQYELLAKVRKEGFTKFKTIANMSVNIMRGGGKYLRVLGAIKKLLANSENKLKEVLKRVQDNKGKRIIIFNEVIESADKLYDSLNKLGILTGIYHSKKKDLSVIDDFDNGVFNVLVCCRSLDEGMDVKSCDMGIIVAGNKTQRQMIQRFGRILRVDEGKGKAVIYQIYCLKAEKGAMEERTKHIRKFVTDIRYE